MDEEKVVMLYPGKSKVYPMYRHVSDSLHPVSISIFNVNGMLVVKITNEHKSRILRLPNGFNVLDLLKEISND